MDQSEELKCAKGRSCDALEGAEVQAEGADVMGVEGGAGVRGYEELGEAPTMRSVLWLSAPAILEQVIQAAVGVTDTLIAGHLPGNAARVAAASAAVGVMAYLQWLAGLLNAAFAVGATAIVARAIGAKRYRVANRTAGTAVAGALCVSVCVAALMFVFSSEVTAAAGLKGLAHEFGTQYLHIMTITIALQAAAMIGLACLRGAGDTVTPMLVTGAVAVINIFTSSSFTFGWLGAPAWGIRGNAFGTMLAYLVGGMATLVMLLGARSRIQLKLRHFRIVPHIVGRLLKIGMPAWAEGMLLWLGQFLIVIFVINANDAAIKVDGATMAAHNTVIRIESLAFLPGFGLGIACSSLVGRYLGAGRKDHALLAARLSTRMTVLTMTVLGIPMVFCPRLLLRVMVDSDPVVELAVWPMILAGLAQAGFALSISKGAALKGAGATVGPMVATSVGMALVRVPVLLGALWVFGRMGWSGMGLLAVWIGIACDLNFRGLVNWMVFRRGKWMNQAV